MSLPENAKEFLKTIFNSDAYLTLPILNIGDRKGHTDYIDFITPDEMTSPIMIGIDRFQRFFISFCIKYKRNGHYRINVFTLFQRYTNDLDFYSSGTIFSELPSILEGCYVHLSTTIIDKNLEKVLKILDDNNTSYFPMINKDPEINDTINHYFTFSSQARFPTALKMIIARSLKTVTLV